MKTHSRLLAIIIAFAVIFSSIAFNSISFAEENPSEDQVVILEDSYEEEGLSEGEEEGLPEEEIVEEVLPEGEGDEEGKEELDLPQEEAKEEDLPKEEVVEEDLPKEDIIQEPMNIQSESMEVNIQTIDEYGRKYEDIEGNDKLKFKVDPPVSKTMYFDKDGKETNDSDSIYWVKFTVSGDKKYLSFEANNLVLELLSVKGGDNYRLYKNVGYSGSNFRSPLNNGGNIPQISHYSFEIKIIPPADPKGEIDVTKIVKDKDLKVIQDNETEFKFRLYKLVGDDWVEVKDESPFYITGNDTVTIDNLPLGKYKVVEVDIPTGFELISSNNIQLVLDKDHLERKADFTNKEVPPPPPWKGTIKVKKTVVPDSPTHVPSPADIDFTLKGPNGYDVTLTTDISGEVIFTNLDPGRYTITEDVPEGYTSSLPEEGFVIDLPEDADEQNYLEIRVRNTKDIPPPPPKGEIDVTKKVVDEDDDVIEDNQRFMFRLYRLVDDEWDEVINESPFFITGNNTVTIDNLPLGKYKIEEVQIPSGYSLDSQNNIVVELDLENLEDKAEFTNKKDDTPPPPKGEIEVTKRVQTRTGSPFTNNSTRFYFELDMRIDGRWVLVDEGFVVGNGSLVDKGTGTLSTNEQSSSNQTNS